MIKLSLLPNLTEMVEQSVILLISVSPDPARSSPGLERPVVEAAAAVAFYTCLDHDPAENSVDDPEHQLSRPEDAADEQEEG
ncbi:hypothetical protein PG994_002772 [Apiospora phragmitis]|uniref:Uncharacterized protein n=1 Tax=Apiospora phragmitis TaxID=2905665 RepID=A0ABR1W8Z2_9PEZI